MPKVFLPLIMQNPQQASQRVVLDPITRIEGHLRIEVQVDNGYVTDAWSSGMMFRGLELVLKGRDPRDAWLFAQRICGV
jgi:Ni,Fe-hydrogenase I large subunit